MHIADKLCECLIEARAILLDRQTEVVRMEQFMSWEKGVRNTERLRNPITLLRTAG